MFRIFKHAKPEPQPQGEVDQWVAEFRAHFNECQAIARHLRKQGVTVFITFNDYNFYHFDDLKLDEITRTKTETF